MRLRTPWLASLFTCLALLISSCASYQKKVGEARGMVQAGKYSEAADKLAPLAKTENGDQLVYLFDYGTVLQITGRYQESIQYFSLADRLSDVVDYHSISRVTGSLLLNEGMVQYKGDDYEKVLINAFLAMNYLMLGKSEDALVETRRLNQKLYKYKFEAKRNYEQNPFAFYMAAMIWENDRNWDNAYIDYNNTYGVAPNFPYLREDLIRAAIVAQRDDEVSKWKKAFPEVKVRPTWRDPRFGEIVFIYQQGWGPRKFPNPQYTKVPKLYPVHSRTQRAKMTVEGIGVENTQTIFSVQDVAIKTLDDEYAELIAKRLAGVATKAVVSDQIRQKNKLLGELAWLGMNLADQADLRQWSTLPETFQIARKIVPVGDHVITVTGLDSSGAPTGEEFKTRISVRPGKKSFFTWRSVR